MACQICWVGSATQSQTAGFSSWLTVRSYSRETTWVVKTREERRNLKRQGNDRCTENRSASQGAAAWRIRFLWVSRCSWWLGLRCMSSYVFPFHAPLIQPCISEVNNVLFTPRHLATTVTTHWWMSINNLIMSDIITDLSQGGVLTHYLLVC